MSNRCARLVHPHRRGLMLSALGLLSAACVTSSTGTNGAGPSGSSTGGSVSSTATASSGSGGATAGTASAGGGSATTSTATSTTSTTSTTGSGGGGSTPSGLFEATNPWNVPIDGEPVSPSSAATVGWLAKNGGFGLGKLQIDFSIKVLRADADTPKRTFEKTADFFSPDCDDLPFPVPAGGSLEGESGYSCDGDGDCHLLVVHPAEKKLYEMWRANFTGGKFYGGCAAVWDLTRAYPPNLRGEQCTSADAGGFPIAAMVFSADEVFAGEIPHAIRFILPNARIRKGVYVRPATHATPACQGGPDAPPYGVRFRLRKDYPLASLPSDGSRVVAKAMQRYGMLLSDGGNVALTALSDESSQHSWSEVGVGSLSLASIQVEDFEVVALGEPIPYTADCVRNP